jgi:tRNA-dihydrouridine synthase B
VACAESVPTAAHESGPFGWVPRSPFFQAGLAGYSDTAMRLIARRHGCPFCITEAMLDYFLINGGRGLAAAELDDEDHPIAGQLMGSHPEEIAAGAKILVKLGYDVIDVNFGCPVKKIKKKCRGGHLLSAPDEAIAILDAVRQAVGDDAPVSVKMRRGYDDTPEMAANFYRIFEKAIDLGYAAVTVHGRTVEQKYLGPSRWPFLADLTRRYSREMAGGFLIFGSGDVFAPQAIFDMITRTGVSAVSVARGCIGNPWLFTQAHQIMRGQPVTRPTVAQQRQVLLEHFDLAVAEQGEAIAGREMRKFGIKFSLHHPSPQAVKDAFIHVQNVADWRCVLDAHYTEAAEALLDQGPPSTEPSTADLSELQCG